MTGTILNCIGILAGAVAGKFMKSPPQRITEAYIRIVLSAFIVFYGLRLTWISMNGPFLSILAQLLLVILSLALGRALGRLLRLQHLSNQLGQFARDRITSVSPSSPNRLNDGFLTCAALFCAAPLGILGAVQDGLSNYYYPLAAKGVIEAFAVLGFVRMFGWGAVLSAIPVLAFQGTISILVRQIEPALAERALVDPINATGGLLVFSVALVMLDLKKLHLADYLPSLAVAPLLAWLVKSF
jgi:uncharacterized membrane protein YqgA involved in biofilm formation